MFRNKANLTTTAIFFLIFSFKTMAQSDIIIKNRSGDINTIKAENADQLQTLLQPI
jgi:hypothetical protein